MSDENIVILESLVEIDETGEEEVLTNDLFPLVDLTFTSHLDEQGLPKIGTFLKPGMIAIGKIAYSRAALYERKPTDLEIHALDRETIKSKFGHLWENRSVYVPEDVTGIVEKAEIIQLPSGKSKAIVAIRCTKPS